MSKSALADAYAAGFRDGRQSAATVGDDDAGDHCALGFDRWWTRSTETLDRSSWTPPECPDNSHDYRVDDSDGFLKCVVCKKVIR